MEWKDVTFYSSSSKDRTPTSFELRHGTLVLSVYRVNGVWRWSCLAVRVDHYELVAKDAKEAMSEAVCSLVEHVRRLQIAAQEMWNEHG